MMEDINSIFNNKFIISLIILVSGIGLIFKAIYIYYFYTFLIKKWHKTDGTIISVKIEYFKSKTDADTEGWKTKIIYEYIVNNINYQNDRITNNIGFLSPSKTIAENCMNKYIKGQRVIVYFDKKKPENSVIDDSFNSNNYLLIIMGILSFLISYMIYNS